MFSYLFNVWIAALLFTTGNQETVICQQMNTSFYPGEKISYTIYYNVIGLYVNAGNAEFTVTNSNWNGNPSYLLTATGRSNKNYDWIFKVRDKYQSNVSIQTMLPYKFEREINEGSFHQKQSIHFNQTANSVSTDKGTFKSADCTFDVISAIYAARNIDFSNRVMNEKIFINFFLDNELYPSYFKYLGKASVTTKYGRFNAIKLAPLLVKGTIFEGGEKMIIWVTDDENHIPIRIETPIIVGSIKVDMFQYENIRYPMTSLIELTK